MLKQEYEEKLGNKTIATPRKPLYLSNFAPFSLLACLSDLDLDLDLEFEFEFEIEFGKREMTRPQVGVSSQ